MPHINIDCSENLVERVDLKGLVAAVHEAAISTGVFRIGAVRTRAQVRDLYMIADGHPDNAFVTVTVRMGQGRDESTRRRVGEIIFAELCRYLAPVYNSSPLAISLEVQEIGPPGTFKKNNLHTVVPERAKAPTV
jgi:5-carboxymethyl-2-hydroxymuconate isomerase